MTKEGDAVSLGAQNRLFALLLPVFFGGGLLNSSVNLLVPRLKVSLSLDYAQALSVHLAYYSSYLLFALPGALLAGRVGHLRTIAAGLSIIAAACASLGIAMRDQSFPGVLASLLLMSTGVTFLQISGNVVTGAFGTGSRMASRFTLLQAFNSLGTVLGPLGGAWLLLGDRRVALTPFLLASAGFIVAAMLFLWNRDLIRPAAAPQRPPLRRLAALGRTPRMAGGIAAIFAYVGAEVTIGTLAVSYLTLPGTAGLTAPAAGRWVSLYWLGAMAGRFAGSSLVLRLGAPRLLIGACGGAMLLLLVALSGQGGAGAAALLAIGLFHSVMFPLAYALALPDRAEDAPLAAMLLCMAVAGGAVVPFLTGLLADRIGLIAALGVPGLCYLVVAAFAYSRSLAVEDAA